MSSTLFAPTISKPIALLTLLFPMSNFIVIYESYIIMISNLPLYLEKWKEQNLELTLLIVD